MIDAKEIKKEKDYLRNVLYILEKEIEKNSKKVKDIDEDLSEEMKYAWDPTNLLNETEFTYAIADIHRQSYTKNNLTDKIKAYKRMVKSAYFARFDFDDGEEVTPVYLGIISLIDGDFFYVYDWRAPISSMFYDYELGDASYVTPSGEEIKGKITLKRQYKIENDQIKEIFDTDMQIIDSILQKMLQDNTSDKMKNIVATIQKEQNKVIRKNDVEILVVSGPAGSGKTSVAMHKIAYILYKYKNKINNSNVLILSPNDIFSNYISNVLPQIGEDNVYETTFGDYIKTFLTEYKVAGSLADVYEKTYSNIKKGVEYNSIKLKFSAVYVHLIEKYLERHRNEILGIKDIEIGGTLIMNKEYLEKLAAEFDISGLSFVEQYKRLVDKIILHTTIKAGNDKNKINIAKKDLQIDKIKPKDIYNKLYSNRDEFVKLVEEIYNISGTPKSNRLTINELSDIFNYTSSNLSKGIIPYEDVSAYLYLKDRLIGAIRQNKIKFVIIDEAQDYSLMQYKILSGIFTGANITILGDLNQSILPFSSYKSFDTVLNILSDGKGKVRSESMYLSKTYRSTTEINTFAKKIINDSALYNQVERHGDPVEVIELADKTKYSTLVETAIKLKKQYNSVAIITKTQAEADLFKGYLAENKKTNQVKIITKKDKTFASDKVMIIPSYLAKGLEFDAVLISNTNSDSYTEDERNLLYVCVTRALHKLNIYYTGELTPVIKM